ncbi:hypothetical protein AMTR_s00005p00239620 [Amborella trichopoda]|uniref:Uncharacterized protein n=1 Tax=Amborella trichopoda TaxID=13333 RepID=W1PAD3_AMBTC|nr:hypothetical protein AMTR_s00005p00239620 [Amborella trichopoda]
MKPLEPQRSGNGELRSGSKDMRSGSHNVHSGSDVFPTALWHTDNSLWQYYYMLRQSAPAMKPLKLHRSDNEAFGATPFWQWTSVIRQSKCMLWQ